MKKTLIAASVGALMLAAAGTASAAAGNTLLFPYFTTAAGAQSVLSLSNTGAAGTTTVPFAVASDSIHYVYNYGPNCTHYDASGAMSQNDILSHSIADPTAGGFGLAIGSDKSSPVYFPLANQSGFLVVSNTSASAGAQALRGSMAIIDPATGLVVSYPGIVGGATEGDFSGITDKTFALTALPSAFVTTAWYGVVTGNMNTAIGAKADWTASLDFNNGGIVWNNDEVPYSGAATKTLKCGGSILPTDLLNTAQAAAVGPNGGLIKTTATLTAVAATAPANPATGAVLMKMQAIQPATGGVFVGKQFLHQEVAGFVATP